MSIAPTRRIGKLFIALVVLLSLALAGCVGSGRIVTETRSVGSFHGLTLESSGDVDLRLGSTQSLTVEAEENILPYLITEVVDGQLVISTKPLTGLQITRPVRYTVVATDLDKVVINGSGNVVLHELDVQDLDLTVDGSGDLTADGSAERVKVYISGSGDVVLSKLTVQDLDLTTTGSGGITVDGTAERLNVDVSGSGSVRASDLEVPVATVRTSGSGGATVWATESLDASTSGSGDISYYGEPQVTSNSSGSGDVRSAGKK